MSRFARRALAASGVSGGGPVPPDALEPRHEVAVLAALEAVLWPTGGVVDAVLEGLADAGVAAELADRRSGMEPPQHAPAHIVELSTGIRASPEAVWDAILDHERQPAWLGGFQFVGDWQIGEPLALVGTLNGREYREGGVLLAFEPQKRLAYSHWSAFWRVPDTPEHRAVLTLVLAPEGDGTRVSVHHALPEVEAIAPHSRFFWRGALEQLRRLLEG